MNKVTRERFVNYAETTFIDALLNDKDLFKEASLLKRGVEVALEVCSEPFTEQELFDIMNEAANRLDHTLYP